MSNVILNILSEFKGKGAFKQADSAVVKLQKSVRNLAGAFGIAYTTRAFVTFGKQSVQAFSEAEKSNVQLANSVKNLGLSFAQSNITNFLDKISASSGIAGETLNEAFQALLTTSGSLTKSQELLNLALDVSAGSTVDLVTVSSDLAKAYTGQTRGLTKYKTGLTQAQLKVASFSDLQARLTAQFSGANQTYLESYAGKMQILGEAAGNAQEIIGGGLVDALGILGGKGVNDIEKASEAMSSFAVAVADVIRGQAVVAKNLADLGGGTGGKFGNAIKTYFKEVTGIQALQDLGQASRPRPTAGRRFMGGAQANLYDASAAQEKKFQQEQKKFRDAQLKAQKQLTAEQKKQALLKKASTMFDMEQANIIAGLKKNITEDERRRLELQLALLTGNTDEASRLTKELAIAQGLGVHLANYLATLPDAKNPFTSWAAYLDAIQAKIDAINAASRFTSVPSTNTTGVTQAIGYAGAGSTAMAEKQSYEFKFVGDGELTSAIAKSMQQASLSSGNQAYIDRRTGGFGP
jgi:hypothetical protein